MTNRHPGRAFLGVALGVYLPGLLVLAWFAPESSDPAATAFRLAAAQAVVLIAWAPSLDAPGVRGWTRLAAIVGVGVLALAFFEVPRGRVPLVEIAVLAGFAAALRGLHDLLHGARLGDGAARVAPLVLGALSITTLSWSGPFIESLADAADGVDLAVRVNPLAAIAGGALQIDWARLRPVTYDAFVGQYYPFSYPGPLAASLGWLTVGGILGGAGSLLTRLRDLQSLQSSGSSEFER